MKELLGATPGRRFAVLAAAAVLLHIPPYLYLRMEGEISVFLYAAHLYAVLPLCAVLLPFWAGLGGVHPLAACFPIGLPALLLPVYWDPAVGLICLLLSLVACTAGQEKRKRKMKENKGRNSSERNRPWQKQKKEKR